MSRRSSGSRLDPLLDGLLNRRRQRVGGERRFGGEVPRAAAVLRDAARIHQRAHELLGEERIPSLPS